ncbi:MAG: hypothetical protein ACE5I0_01525 [Candidatus Binatia bacterium]
MKHPPPYGGGILHLFGGIRRSTLLRLPCGVGSHSEALVSTVVSTPRGEPSFGGSTFRIHPRPNSRGLLRRRINSASVIIPYQSAATAYARIVPISPCL